MTRSQLPRWWPFAVLGGFAFFLFWQYFLLDQTLYAGDTAFVLLPFHHYIIDHLSHGVVPLWNPHLFGGTPALAEAQYQIFYPPNLLLFLVGVSRGAGWLLPLHLGFMAAGTYLFARRALALSRTAATFSALAFAFGGCVQSRLAVPVFTEAAAWVPWMFFWYDKARYGDRGATLLAGFALAMQLVTGGTQYAFYALALLVAYHFFGVSEVPTGATDTAAATLHSNEKPQREMPQRRLPSRGAWVALLLLLIIGVGLAAAQLAPQWELAKLSDRSTHPSYEFSTQFSLAPIHFAVTMLFPKFYGLFNTATADGFFPGEETGYLGVGTLCLIAAAVVAARPRRLVWFWLAAMLVSVAIAFGKYNPLYHVLYHVPGFAMFRAPARWLLTASFCGALLAGMGLQTILQNSRNGILALRAALACALVLLIIGAATLLSPSGAAALAVPQTPFGPWGQIALVAVVAGLLSLPLLLANKSRNNEDANPKSVPVLHLVPRALLVLLALDLFCVSQDMEMQHTLSVAATETRPETLTALQSAAFQERFWPGKSEVPMEPWQAGNTTAAPMEFRARSTAAMRVFMPSCVPAEFQTSGLTGAWGSLMPLRRHPQPIYEAGTPMEIQQKWLRLLNVRYHLSLQPLADAGLNLVTSNPLYVYRDDLAMPRAFFATNPQWVETSGAEEAVSDKAFDPHRSVILERSPGAPDAKSVADSATVQSVPVTIESYGMHRIAMTANAPAAGYIVLMDSFYPGWKASVDGKPAAIQPANWVGRGIAVAPGAHHIEMWFEPQSVRFGLFITLLVIAAMAATLTSRRKAEAAS